MNKEVIFLVIGLVIFAVVCSLLFGGNKEEIIKEPEVIETIEPEIIVEEPVEVIEISEGRTENIEELKHLKRNEVSDWNYTYLQNYTNIDCYARCKDNFCEVIKTFCSINETLELEELIKIV